MLKLYHDISGMQIQYISSRLDLRMLRSFQRRSKKILSQPATLDAWEKTVKFLEESLK